VQVDHRPVQDLSDQPDRARLEGPTGRGMAGRPLGPLVQHHMPALHRQATSEAPSRRSRSQPNSGRPRTVHLGGLVQDQRARTGSAECQGYSYRPLTLNCGFPRRA
jgi:hypothetical protein